MIDVLGKKRIIILAILAGANLLLAYLVYMTLAPGLETKQRDLQGAVNQVTSVRSDISRMQIEFDQLATQQDRYNKLRDSGFFNDQKRDQAEKILATIQKQAGVVSAVATIKAGVLEDNAEAAKADYKLLSSPISIHIEAVDPLDVIRYLYLLQRFFPGHLAIQTITFERKSEINGTILRSIASGANPTLVSSDIDLLWQTMIPKTDVSGAAPPGGG